MKRISALFALAVSIAACGSEPPVEADAGPFDAGPPPPCETDTDCAGSYCNPGSNLCCVPASPTFEICGDHIDQNCDRRDESCGDNDGDGVQACRPGEDPIGGVCDCDDERADVRPPFGTVPGAPEACDAIDNDCNGRTDESSQCCEGCASLDRRDRADICTVEGACECTTAAGDGPCAESDTCCSAGCVDVQVDALNCGFCGAACTGSSDRCVAGNCACGDGPPCDLDYPCVDGVCQTD